MGKVKNAMIEDNEIEVEISEHRHSLYIILNNITKLIESKNFKSENNEEYKNLRNFIVHNIPNVNNYTNSIDSKFDLKSSIKLSYGTKKLLDNINNKNSSYEELILHLIQENKKLKNERKFFLENIKSSKELINLDFSSYERNKKIFEFLDFKIQYSLNKFSPIDENFQFKINIEKISRDGKEIQLNKAYQIIYLLFSETNEISLREGKIIGELILYFMILYNLLKENYKIKGKIVNNMISRLDYWDYTLNKFHISENIKKKDIQEKIESFKIQLKQLKINKIKNE